MSYFISPDEAYETGCKNGKTAFENRVEEIDDDDDSEELAEDILDEMDEKSEGPYSSEETDDAELKSYDDGFIDGFCDAFEKHFDDSESQT